MTLMKKMIKTYKWTLLFSSLLALSPVLVGLILWNRLPAQIPTHFSGSNTPDDWSSKATAIFGMPLFLFAMQWLCFLCTSADPKRQNISPKLIRVLLWFMAILSPTVICSCYAVALGVNINIGMLVNLLVGIIFLILGNYLHKVKQNYTIGIRIPWALNSEENWNRTHRLSAWIFILGGIVMIANAFLLSEALLFFVIFALLFIPYGYSFLLYKRGI